MDSMNVLLADDHPIFLAGIKGILALDPSIHIVAEAHCAAQLLLLAEKYLPDLVISDAYMPRADTATVIQSLKEQWPGMKILIISESDEEEKVLKLLASGIDGYTLKEDSPELLLQAVREVMKGGMWLSPRLIKQFLGYLFVPCSELVADKTMSKILSKREQEVLKLVAMGLENCEIADSLCITKRTVQNHVSAVYQKLSIKSRSQAVLYAIRQGVVKH
jgi:two-component system, NarL family, response regulator DegU